MGLAPPSLWYSEAPHPAVHAGFFIRSGASPSRGGAEPAREAPPRCWCTALREYIRGGGSTTLRRPQFVCRFYPTKFLCRIISKRTTTTTESIVADF
jgi:hypothetical protein